ncbi:MAG: PEGA domain-containing protein, partial [Myxococcota bacterium]
QDPNRSAAELLDSAEIAIARGEPSEAASHLRAFAGLPVSDPTLLSRKERLAAELQVASRVATTRDLLPIDPELALSHAVALDAEYPGEPAVAALLDAARAAVRAPPEPRTTPRASAEPSGSIVDAGVPPPPAPALVNLAIGGSPDGAEVRVDGVVVGRLPVALDLPPGPHQVQVTAAGYADHRSSVELGAPRALAVHLEPAALTGAGSARPTGLQDPFGAGTKPQGLQDPFGGTP